MIKQYFPGANSGKGFFSRFSGIVPTWEKAHYTYVLKGGPGVGKNTLMKKVAKLALEKGYSIEEFHCASDPSSLDAVRVIEKGIVLLDGTSPHSIDPVLPGICDEVVDLGHFKNYREFAANRGEVEILLAENKKHYNAAYAMLGAAYALKKEAISAASDAVDLDKLHGRLSEVLGDVQNGEKRELFARSATPMGVVDYSDTFLPQDIVAFSGIVGEVALCEVLKMLLGKRAEVFYDFVVPEYPHAIAFDGGTVAIKDGGDSLGDFCGNVPQHVEFLLSEVERLVKRAIEELAKSLYTHDKIEKIYRDYVDYDRVNEESEKLLKKIM